MRKVNFEGNHYLHHCTCMLINPLTPENFQTVANRLQPNSPELHLKIENNILFHFVFLFFFFFVMSILKRKQTLFVSFSLSIFSGFVGLSVSVLVGEVRMEMSGKLRQTFLTFKLPFTLLSVNGSEGQVFLYYFQKKTGLSSVPFDQIFSLFRHTCSGTLCKPFLTMRRGLCI